MNKKYLVIMVLLILMLFTGCDVKYSLKFDKNVNEKIDFLNYQVNYSDELYFSPFEIISQEYSYSGFAGSESSYLLENNYNNVDELLNNSALFDLYSDKEFIKVDGKKISIDCDIYNLVNEIKNNYGLINNLEIELYIPYYVSKHNADSVKNNIYTWVIDDIENDKVIINFDTSKPADFMQKIISFSIIGIIVIGIICVIIYFVGKNKKANEI